MICSVHQLVHTGTCPVCCEPRSESFNQGFRHAVIGAEIKTVHSKDWAQGYSLGYKMLDDDPKQFRRYMEMVYLDRL